MLPNETVTRTSRILLEFRAAEGRWVCQGFAKIAPENGRKRDFSVRDHNLARRLHSMRDYELRRWEGLGKRRTFFIVYLRGRPRVRIAPGAPRGRERGIARSVSLFGAVVAAPCFWEPVARRWGGSGAPQPICCARRQKMCAGLLTNGRRAHSIKLSNA